MVVALLVVDLLDSCTALVVGTKTVGTKPVALLDTRTALVVVGTKTVGTKPVAFLNTRTALVVGTKTVGKAVGTALVWDNCTQNNVQEL